MNIRPTRTKVVADAAVLRSFWLVIACPYEGGDKGFIGDSSTLPELSFLSDDFELVDDPDMLLVYK